MELGDCASKRNIEVIFAPHVHDPTHPNHAYWDFPNDDPKTLKEKMIDRILNEERIRLLLSSKAVKAREVNYHRWMQQQQNHDNMTTDKDILDSTSADYWNWNINADPSNMLGSLAQQKKDIIKRILDEEKQRYILSTENIENNLQKEAHLWQRQLTIEF